MMSLNFKIICNGETKIISQKNEKINLEILENYLNEKRREYDNLVTQLQELKLKINKIQINVTISKILIFGLFSKSKKNEIEILKNEKENILNKISECFIQIFYEFDEKTAALYNKFIESKDEILSSKEIRNIVLNPYNKTHKEIVCKWTSDEYSFLKCNFDCLYFGDTNDKFIYLFPSFFLLDDGIEKSEIRLYNLKDSVISFETEDVEEYGYAPSDAKKIDECWMYQTKHGERDLRYNNNRKIPVIEYGAIHIKINNIVKEKFRVSNLSKAENFVKSLNNFIKTI